MLLAGNFSSFLQGLKVNLVELIEHGRRLGSGPNIECRGIFRRAAISVCGSEALGHSFVKEIADRTFHAFHHFLPR